MTSGKVLDIKPANLPVHSVYVAAVGIASDVPIVSEFGIKIDCIINDYLSKDKIVEIPVTIFHPLESRLKSQSTNVRRGSVLFFSGEITNVDGQLYLELHNFSFLKGQVSPKANFMPWLETGSSSTPSTLLTRMSNAQLIHKQQKSPDSAKYKPFQPMKLADIATNMLSKDDKDDNDMSEMVTEKI